LVVMLRRVAPVAAAWVALWPAAPRQHDHPPAVRQVRTVRCETPPVRAGQRGARVEYVLVRQDLVRLNRSKFDSRYGDPQRLGAGAYGSVWRYKHRETGVLRAVKILPTTVLSDRKQFELEINALALLDHPNIIRLVEYFEEKGKFYLVFPLCQGPDLFDYIVDESEKNGAVSERDAARICRQMIKAVHCCHLQGIIHKDIKPENFMFATTDATSVLRMIDLGLSEFYDPASLKLLKRPVCSGSEPYMAPEVHMQQYDESCDMWSIGAVLFTMLLGEQMFTPEECKRARQITRNRNFVFNVLRQVDQARLKAMSPDARSFMMSLLAYDPADRPKPEQALAHPFLAAAECTGQGLPDLTDPRQRSAAKECLERLDEFQNFPALRQIAHRVLVLHWQPSDLRQMRDFFRAADVEGRGEVSGEELETALKSALSTTVSLPPIMSSGQKTGHISYDDFLAATLDPALCRREPFLKAAWAFMDPEGKGKILSDDLVALLPRSTPGQRAAIVEEVGENGMVTWAQFLKMFA